MRAHALSVSLQSECEQKIAERRSPIIAREVGFGHVTPSFLADDKTELQSNFNLQVSLI